MKKIGIGYENFKDFTKEKLYYVDKTMLIKGYALPYAADPRKILKIPDHSKRA